MALGGNGAVIIVGEKNTSSFNDDGMALAYSAAGGLLWSDYVIGTAGGDDWGADVVADSAGNAYALYRVEDAASDEDFLIKSTIPAARSCGRKPMQGRETNRIRPGRSPGFPKQRLRGRLFSGSAERQ